MIASRRVGLGHLAVIFVVWGSTYLAIRVAVAPGGFSPMWMGALRMAVAGGALLVFARFRGHALQLRAHAKVLGGRQILRPRRRLLARQSRSPPAPPLGHPMREHPPHPSARLLVLARRAAQPRQPGLLHQILGRPRIAHQTTRHLP